MKSKFDLKSLTIGAGLGEMLVFVIAADKKPDSWEYSVMTERKPTEPTHPAYKEIRRQEFNGYVKEHWDVVCEYISFVQERDITGNNESVPIRQTILRRIKK